MSIVNSNYYVIFALFIILLYVIIFINTTIINIIMKIKIPQNTDFSKIEQKLLSISTTEDFITLMPDLKSFYEEGLVPNSLTHKFQDSFSYDIDLYTMRKSFVYNYGFTLLSVKLVTELSKQLLNKNVLDVGAGTGFLAKQLYDNKINIQAIDKENNVNSSYGFKNKYFDIINEDGIKYIKENPQINTIILSWPNYNSEFATEVLKAMTFGQKLYYMGEEEGGCTGSYSFFSLLAEKTKLNKSLTKKLQKHNLSWPGIRDNWYVYEIIR